MKKVTCNLFHEPVEITNALIAVASQEGNDGPEYDLMMEAADRIRVLEDKLQNMRNTFQEELKLAIPAMREFAQKNPIHQHQGITQDPCGVHAWLARNVQYENPIL